MWSNPPCSQKQTIEKGFFVYYLFLKNDVSSGYHEGSGAQYSGKYSQNLKLPYIGCTINVKHRLRQHNREIVGGAKKTLHGNGHWFPGLIVGGFPNKKAALRFEWLAQRKKSSRFTIRGEKNKLTRLLSLLSSDSKNEGKDMYNQKKLLDWERIRKEDVYLLVHPLYQQKLQGLSHNFQDVLCSRYSSSFSLVS